MAERNYDGDSGASSPSKSRIIRQSYQRTVSDVPSVQWDEFMDRARPESQRGPTKEERELGTVRSRRSD
jgi:hypothetical protein